MHIRKLVVFLIIICALAGPKFVQGSVSSCSASVTPHSVYTDSNDNYTFTINNTSSQNIVWIKITVPSPVYWSINSITNPSGWTGSSDDETAIYTGGTLSVSGSLDITLEGGTNDFTTDSTAWTVQVSDDAGGANPTTCTGSLGTSITTSSPPVLSSLTVSNITDTSAKITWNTNVNSDSTVEYGTTSNYGLTVTSSTQTTSHSLDLTGLSANTTYHANVKSTSSEGTGQSGDFTFVTSSEQTTITINTTTTTTTTNTVTRTLSDTTSPTVNVSNNFKKVYDKAPVILGSATDDKGIANVEYSLDGGINWADTDLSGTIGQKVISFSFTPNLVDDGNHEIAVRSIDTSGNKSTIKKYTLIIDRIPPIAGNLIVSLGPITVSPNSKNVMTLLSGINYDFYLSSVGGATEIDIFVGDEKFTLTKSLETNIWRGVISVNNVGVHEAKIIQKDGGGNVVTKKVNSFNVIESGVVTENGNLSENSEVSVFVFDNLLKGFILWEGSEYNQSNPQITKKGKYQFILPSGKYYLEVKKDGFKKVRSTIFETNASEIIRQNFDLKSSKVIHIGNFKLTIPYFVNLVKIDNLDINDNNLDEVARVDKESFDFSFVSDSNSLTNIDLLGKTNLIYLTNSYLPGVSDQIKILEKFADDKRINILTVLVQETPSKARLFKNRGNYSLPIYSDLDGKFLENINSNHLPITLVLDKQGLIDNIYTDFLTEKELVDLILKIGLN